MYAIRSYYVRITIHGRPALDNVCDIDIFPLHAHFYNETRQEHSCISDERESLKVFFLTRGRITSYNVCYTKLLRDVHESVRLYTQSGIIYTFLCSLNPENLVFSNKFPEPIIIYSVKEKRPHHVLVIGISHKEAGKRWITFYDTSNRQIPIKTDVGIDIHCIRLEASEKAETPFQELLVLVT